MFFYFLVFQQPKSGAERAANARVEAAVTEVLQPLLDVLRQSAQSADSAVRDFFFLFFLHLFTHL